ncbi:MAG TPA: O-antigen ligase family protein [Usitatibacter sp.]|nr:O-antigen ligase family protein [Usitatibacter sp.]
MFFILVACAALLWRALAKREPLGLALVPRAFAATAIAWAALCVASLAWSIDAGYSAQELRRELLYGSLAFVVFFAGTRSAAELHLWVRLLIAGALVLGVCEWLRALFPNEAWARSISVGPGPFSTHVVMILPLLAIAAWRAPDGLGWRLPATLATGLALLLLGLAGESRILWVALIAGSMVAFPLYAKAAAPGGRARAIAGRVFVASLVVLVIFMALSTEYKIRYYPRAASTAEMLALDERPLIWRVALGKVRDAPVLGHGYGRDIVGEEIRTSLENAGAPPYAHGHSTLIDSALQLGVVGFLAFVAMMGSLVGALAAARRTAAGMPVAIAGLAMFAAYAVKNCTDDFYFRPNSLVFWAIAGMLLGRSACARAAADSA